MDSLKSIFEGAAVPLLLALFGGVARVLKSGVKTWRQFAASLAVSGFAGVIVHLFIQDADLSASFKAALVGLSGYSGGAILDALASRLQKTVADLGSDGLHPQQSPAASLPGAPDGLGNEDNK